MYLALRQWVKRQDLVYLGRCTIICKTWEKHWKSPKISKNTWLLVWVIFIRNYRPLTLTAMVILVLKEVIYTLGTLQVWPINEAAFLSYIGRLKWHNLVIDCDKQQCTFEPIAFSFRVSQNNIMKRRFGKMRRNKTFLEPYQNGRAPPEFEEKTFPSHFDHRANLRHL